MTGKSQSSPLAVQYNVFFEQKEGNRFDQFEDAFAIDGVPVVRIAKDADRSVLSERTGIGTLRDLPPIWRVAVADGATGSSFSQLWARHLVESFISSHVPVRQDFQDIREFTAQAADSWNTRVIHEVLSGYKPGSMRHLRVKNGLLNTTQAATLLLMEFDTVQHTWKAAALGDTMVFQFSGDGLNRNRPFRHMTGETFGNNPILVTSSRAEQDTYIWKPLDRDDAYAEGSFDPEDDVFLLMTDAIAAYFLYLVDYFERSDRTTEQLNEIEHSAGLFIKGRPFRKPKQDKEFAEWAAKRRTKDNPKAFGRLKNDDITLIRVRFTTATEGVTAPYEVYPYEPQTFPPLVELVEDDGPLAPTTPPPAPANTAPDDAPNRQTPSAKYPFANSANLTPPQTAWQPELPAVQPPEAPPAENPVDMKGVLRPSAPPDVNEYDGDTYQKMSRVVTQPPPAAPTDPPVRPVSTLSETGGFGDLESDFKDDPEKYEAALREKELRRELRRKQQDKHGSQTLPPKPNTLPPENVQNPSNSVTQSAPSMNPQYWFEVSTNEMRRYNDEVRRILKRLEDWDDPGFTKAPYMAGTARDYIVNIWSKFDRQHRIEWVQSVPDSQGYVDYREWEVRIRAALANCFTTLRDTKPHYQKPITQYLYLLRIYMVTWQAFLYLVEVISPPQVNFTEPINEAHRQHALRDVFDDYKRLWNDYYANGGTLPEPVKTFWSLTQDYIYDRKTRLDVVEQILKLKL